MEDRKMIELKVQGVGATSVAITRNGGLKYGITESPTAGTVRRSITRPTSSSANGAQHDQIDVRLRESVARLVEESDRRRSAGLDQEADWLVDEAARLRYWIGRIKVASDADWKALEVEIEAEFIDLARLDREEGLPTEPPEPAANAM